MYIGTVGRRRLRRRRRRRSKTFSSFLLAPC